MTKFTDIAHQLEERIVKGIYKPGDFLPSRDPLEHEFGVSYTTILKALDQLEDRGLIHRHQGRGIMVLDPSTNFWETKVSKIVKEYVRCKWSIEKLRYTDNLYQFSAKSGTAEIEMYVGAQSEAAYLWLIEREGRARISLQVLKKIASMEKRGILNAFNRNKEPS